MATSGPVRFSLDFIVLVCVSERRRPLSSTHNSDSCEYINIVARRSFFFYSFTPLYTVCAGYRIGEAYGAHFKPWIQLPVAYVTTSRRVSKRKSPVHIATCRRWRRQRSSIHKSQPSRSSFLSTESVQFRKNVGYCRFLGLESRLADDDRSFWRRLYIATLYTRDRIYLTSVFLNESKFDRRSRSFAYYSVSTFVIPPPCWVRQSNYMSWYSCATRTLSHVRDNVGFSGSHIIQSTRRRKQKRRDIMKRTTTPVMYALYIGPVLTKRIAQALHVLQLCSRADRY